jgi:hypothetical protein
MNDEQMMEAMADAVDDFVTRATSPLLERLTAAEARLNGLPVVDVQAIAKAMLDDAVAPLRSEVGVLKAVPAPVIPDPAEAVDKFAQALVTKLLA